jgi:hypothetical protein
MTLNSNMTRGPDIGVSVVKFYRHPINEWWQTTASLSDGPYRAYHTICALIFQNKGPIALHEHMIAGLSKQGLGSFRRHMDELIRLELVKVSNDGDTRTVDVEWCRDELQHIARKSAAAAKAGRASGASRSSGGRGPSGPHEADIPGPNAPGHRTAYDDDLPF